MTHNFCLRLVIDRFSCLALLWPILSYGLPTELRRNIKQNKGNLFSFPCLCRLWAIFPGRRQPSIFATAALNFRVRNGNGWTHCVKITDFLKLFVWGILLCQRWVIFPGRRQPSIFTTAALNFRVRNGNGWTHCVKNTDYSRNFFRLVHLRGLEPRTHWLRVSCSTSWARGADPLCLQIFLCSEPYVHRKSNKDWKELSETHKIIIEVAWKFKPSVY